MQTETHPVEAGKIRDHLRHLLDQVPVKTAVGVGIQNLFKARNKYLENPRWFLTAGKVFSEPPERIRNNLAGAMVFCKESYSMRGTSGLLSMDISGTDQMVVVQFMSPLSETLFDNRFFATVVKQAELDEKMYTDLYQHSKKPDEEISDEQGGIAIRCTMTRESRAMILLEVCAGKEALAADVEAVTGEEAEKPKHSQPVGQGEALQDRLRTWIRDTKYKCCCAIGLNNKTKMTFRNPQVFIETGTCVYLPPEECEPSMAGPALFTKNPWSLRGSAGVMTYELEGKRLAVMWSVPLSEMVHNNIFNVHVIPLDTPCDRALYEKFRASARPAKEGSSRYVDEDFAIEAEMGTDSRCELVVTICPKHT
jgi:hypothetical protein